MSEQTKRGLSDFTVGLMFWLGPIVALVGGLYLLGVWVDGVW